MRLKISEDSTFLYFIFNYSYYVFCDANVKFKLIYITAQQSTPNYGVISFTVSRLVHSGPNLGVSAL